MATGKNKALLDRLGDLKVRLATVAPCRHPEANAIRTQLVRRIMGMTDVEIFNLYRSQQPVATAPALRTVLPLPEEAPGKPAT